MNTDIRLSTEFWDHPKTVKLERRLELQGPKSLQILWLWSAKNHPDGRLEGEDVEGIEIAAKWPGEEGKFVETLLALRWLDHDGETYILHDWREHNSWAAEADSRSDKSRLSRMAKTHPDLYARLVGEGRQGISRDEYESLTTVERPLNDRKRVLQAQGPSPSPAPMAKENNRVSPLPPGGGKGVPAPPPSPEDDPDVQPNAEISSLNDCAIEFQDLAAAYQQAGGFVDVVPAYKAYESMRHRFPLARIVDDLEQRKDCDQWRRGRIKKLSNYLNDREWLNPIPAARASPGPQPRTYQDRQREERRETAKGLIKTYGIEGFGDEPDKASGVGSHEVFQPSAPTEFAADAGRARDALGGDLGRPPRRALGHGEV